MLCTVGTGEERKGKIKRVWKHIGVSDTSMILKILISEVLLA